ncbi:hypothetical protein MA16_Dca024736 [Dendrobium catenatum]|uniref:Uncharacterized protein n=1 Tax=Dendrobium catenatum TaxID=906689 RepID=A0A2I0WNI5_9ASPA|nr:hypothetical protein MA16_Dca024736 [Dendrobium catenatum]
MRCMKAPLRALRCARDMYVKSLGGCAGAGGGGRGAPMTGVTAASTHLGTQMALEEGVAGMMILRSLFARILSKIMMMQLQGWHKRLKGAKAWRLLLGGLMRMLHAMTLMGIFISWGFQGARVARWCLLHEGLISSVLRPRLDFVSFFFPSCDRGCVCVSLGGGGR